MKKIFELLNGDNNKIYGYMTFNGKFTFRLDQNIDIETWNRVGFIPLDASRYVENKDLFRHLNSRLPITLRNVTNEEKIKYIEDNGLKVASDRFYLRPIDPQIKLTLD